LGHATRSGLEIKYGSSAKAGPQLREG